MTEKLEYIPKFSCLHLHTFIKTGLIFDAFCAQSQHTIPFMKYFYHIQTPLFSDSKFTCFSVGGRFRFGTAQNLLKYLLKCVFLYLYLCPAFLKHFPQKMQIWKNLCCKIRVKECLKITETKRKILDISRKSLQWSSASVNKGQIACSFSKKPHCRHAP